MNHRRIEGDCLEVMRDLPRGHFDLLLTDPPYAMPATYYTGQHGRRRWSDTSIMQAWWRQVMLSVVPLLKDNGMMAVFANAAAVAAFWPIMHELLKGMQLIVWNKATGSGCPFVNTVEFIVVGARGRIYKRRGPGYPSILQVSRVPVPARNHPAQKPVELLKILAGQLCPENGRVLDPFAGSFSTEAACDQLGLECTSIEWGEAVAMPDDQVELAL